MYRSASANRIWDGQLNYQHYHHRRHSHDIEELPTYDPSSSVARKEKAVARFARNLIHAIPLVLLFCAFLLWFFSSPTDVVLDRNLLGVKFQGGKHTIEADLDSDATAGHFPLMLGDLDPSEIRQSRISIFNNKRSE